MICRRRHNDGTVFQRYGHGGADAPQVGMSWQIFVRKIRTDKDALQYDSDNVPRLD